MNDEPLSGSNPVQSFSRGLDVIRSFGSDHRQMTLSDVARVTGLSRASARRFLLTLVELGYIRSEGKIFSLTPQVLEIGYAYLSSLSLTDVAQPHLEALVDLTHESSSVAVLDRDHVVYVARMPSKRIMNVTISVGTRLAAYATSMGRVLLAGLPSEQRDAYLDSTTFTAYTGRTITDPVRLQKILDRISSQGFATVDQELEIGLRSAAVPIRDTGGTTIAALNVSAQAPRVSMEELRRELLPHVIKIARSIEEDLWARDGQTHCQP